MMMIPEAFGPRYHISTDKRAFYEYHAAIMEPWDGPAAMVFTDGRLVGGTLDRNGLRPCRYVVTTDGLVRAGQRGGRDRVSARADPAERPSSARAHVPGRYRGGPDRGRQRDQGQDRAAKTISPLAGGEPHRTAGLVPAVQARRPIDPKTLAQRLRAFGYTREELQMVVAPDGRQRPGAVGSMGTDTPLAVLSDRPKLLFNYFKQLFAQVTNPPIDPLREGLVMSLMSFTGKQRNLLEETPEHCRQLKLPHPILTNEDMERLRTAERGTISRWSRCRRCSRPDGRDPAAAHWRGAGRIGRRGRAGDCRRGVAADPQRPRRLAQAGRRFPACWPPRRCTTGCLSGGCGARRASSSKAASPAR